MKQTKIRSEWLSTEEVERHHSMEAGPSKTTDIRILLAGSLENTSVARARTACKSLCDFILGLYVFAINKNKACDSVSMKWEGHECQIWGCFLPPPQLQKRWEGRVGASVGTAVLLTQGSSTLSACQEDLTVGVYRKESSRHGQMCLSRSAEPKLLCSTGNVWFHPLFSYALC